MKSHTEISQASQELWVNDVFEKHPSTERHTREEYDKSYAQSHVHAQMQMEIQMERKIQ